VEQAQKVLQLVTVRVDHESAKVKGELAAARKQTDEAIRRAYDVLNALSVLAPSAELSALVNVLLSIEDRARLYYISGGTTSGGGKPNQGGSGSGDSGSGSGSGDNGGGSGSGDNGGGSGSGDNGDEPIPGGSGSDDNGDEPIPGGGGSDDNGDEPIPGGGGSDDNGDEPIPGGNDPVPGVDDEPIPGGGS